MAEGKGSWRKRAVTMNLANAQAQLPLAQKLLLCKELFSFTTYPPPPSCPVCPMDNIYATGLAAVAPGSAPAVTDRLQHGYYCKRLPGAAVLAARHHASGITARLHLCQTWVWVQGTFPEDSPKQILESDLNREEKNGH
eukprot:1146463-Pelagomonas_calceolata.AAC.1